MSRKFDLPGRSPVLSGEAMVATSHPLATGTALQILREGGNAIDAALAASATLCVVEPHMTGIGGDCFAILCDSDGKLHGINGSGRAPASANLEWYLENGFHEIPDNSPHAVTVPCAIRAWEKLHDRFGTMDFARLFADAVRYARSGFPVHARVAQDWSQQTPKLRGQAGAVRHLLRDGEPPSTGEMFCMPALGETLAEIATKGSHAFYSGRIAAEIAATVQAHGGFLTEEDLEAASADWVDPVRQEFCGHEILELPPNGQGITALVLLRLMTATGFPPDPDRGARYHHEMELARLAYVVRDAEIGDPDHLRATPQDLLSDEFIDRLAAQFDPAGRIRNLSLPPLRAGDTIYLSVVDRDRMTVSFINSIYSGFGTGIVTPESGIALQNRGSCFVLTPGHVNAVGPRKRPLHTIIPAMAMQNGRPTISFGVMGGAYQPVGHAHVLANHLQYGMDPQAAIDHPRMFFDHQGNLLAESGVTPRAKDELQRLGHSVLAGKPFGGGQMITIDWSRGVLCAGSDPRKDGQAAGF